MAKVTVEDCLRVVQDRFELVLLSAKRAKEVAMTVGERHDKDDVAALKEVGSGYLDINDLRKRLLYDIHNIPYLSKEETEELDDLEMYEGYEAAPTELYSEQTSTPEEEEATKRRVDEKVTS